MRIPRLPFALSFVLSLLLPTIAGATTTYTFTGTPFNNFFNTSCPPTCRITGSITLAQPLPPNINLSVGQLAGSTSNFTPLSFSFTDGVTIATNATCPTDNIFNANTDANGNITQYGINVCFNHGGSFFYFFYYPPFGTQVGLNGTNNGVSYTTFFASGSRASGGTWSVSSTVVPPGGLHATVGNQRVYLYWNPGPGPIDGYNIQVSHFDGSSFVPLGTVNPSGVLIQGNSFRVFAFANGQFPQNGELYQFTVTAVKNGVESPLSNFVFARPGEFAVSQPPPKPANPILFLHGILSDASTWDTMRDFLAGTALWRFGGTLSYSATDDPRTAAPVGTDLLAKQDFYTANFGNDLANYDVGRPRLLHQADEVQGFILTLFVANDFSKTSVVAHSMGGLAARSYIADNTAEAVRRLSRFTTYGTPHWGVSEDDVLPFIGNLISRGARDLRVDCTNGRLDYTNEASPGFLDQLRLKTLPSQIQYFAIRGHNDTSLITGLPAKQTTLAACFSSMQWDGLIATESADLGAIPASAPAGQPSLTTTPVPLLTTNRIHTQQTNDFSASLCALDPNCYIATVRSPVDIEIAAPDGRSITRQLTEIPGASYMEVAGENGHQIATVVMPFPLGGSYTIRVVPKPRVSPTDTYTLEVVRAGVTTVLAQDQKVEDIPAQPYVLTVLPPIPIDIKPGSSTNPINPRSSGTIPVAILSSPTFDAPSLVDEGSLTFGRTGTERSIAFCNQNGEDVNGDGVLDLVCHFNAQNTDFTRGDTQGILKGKTVEGVPFVGTDLVRIVQ